MGDEWNELAYIKKHDKFVNTLHKEGCGYGNVIGREIEVLRSKEGDTRLLYVALKDKIIPDMQEKLYKELAKINKMLADVLGENGILDVKIDALEQDKKDRSKREFKILLTLGFFLLAQLAQLFYVIIKMRA
jgi:hypothetical protein